MNNNERIVHNPREVPDNLVGYGFRLLYEDEMPESHTPADPLMEFWDPGSMEWFEASVYHHEDTFRVPVEIPLIDPAKYGPEHQTILKVITACQQ